MNVSRLARVLAAVAAAARSVGASSAPPVARPLLTDREVAFLHLLRPAAAPLHVAPQVAMSALLRHPGERRIVDFVLLDDEGCVALLVELDDRMHDRRRDRSRDRDTAAAGYRTLRVEGVTARDTGLLTAAVDDALGRPPRWSPPTLSREFAPRRARNRSAPPNTPRA